jgi:hypothetical protein
MVGPVGAAARLKARRGGMGVGRSAVVIVGPGAGRIVVQAAALIVARGVVGVGTTVEVAGVAAVVHRGNGGVRAMARAMGAARARIVTGTVGAGHAVMGPGATRIVGGTGEAAATESVAGSVAVRTTGRAPISRGRGMDGIRRRLRGALSNRRRPRRNKLR